VNTPLYFLVNGEAAVNFFFVLSGFVLLQRFFRAPTAEYLVIASLKRLPRLMVPAGASIFCGYVVLAGNLSSHEKAAHLTNSWWLASFGNAHFPDRFSPHMSDAFIQMLRVFIMGDSFYYNSNLWTMRPEFVGSLAALACATVAFVPLKPLFRLYMLLFAATAVRLTVPVLFPFIVGGALAHTMANWTLPSLSGATVAAALIAVIVFGFNSTSFDVQTVTSLLAIAGVTASPQLSGWLSGKVGIWLGRISFPLYLVHTLVILSVASLVYSLLAPYSVVLALLGAMITTWLSSLLALWPFLKLEGWWVPLLAETMNKVKPTIGRCLRVLKPKSLQPVDR
jgi:peptidoglycan/LPS O-acetylase OafA/YrhL